MPWYAGQQQQQQQGTSKNSDPVQAPILFGGMGREGGLDGVAVLVCTNNNSTLLVLPSKNMPPYSYDRSSSVDADMGFPIIRGTHLGIPIIRAIVFWGLYWVSLLLGNYHMYILTTPEIRLDSGLSGLCQTCPVLKSYLDPQSM